jgi:hypothetical protein
VFSHDSSEKSDFLSTDDIRKEIQFLSTYTDNCKLQGLKEHRYKLASEVRARYPHLTSDVFNFEVDSQAGTAVFMFQFDNLILDTTYLEDCISRQYIQVAKDFFKVDRAYLFFVTPFGATSFAEAYIKERLPVEYDGYVGVLTVKQLANFLYCQALSSRKLGSVKGDLKQDFDLLLNYKFPEPPPLVVQTSLF